MVCVRASHNMVCAPVTLWFARPSSLVCVCQLHYGLCASLLRQLHYGLCTSHILVSLCPSHNGLCASNTLVCVCQSHYGLQWNKHLCKPTNIMGLVDSIIGTQCNWHISLATSREWSTASLVHNVTGTQMYQLQVTGAQHHWCTKPPTSHD